MLMGVMLWYESFLTLTILLVRSTVGLNNGLGLTPPMGWLSWERFTCNTDCANHPDDCISEKLYMTMADRLVKDGYRDLGYVFVNIDDCWAAHERDNITKQLVADPTRFPRGITWLADYMHTRGLKLGIYADYGTKTCAGYPGSVGYLEIDAHTFASWNVDSVKFDGCNSDPKMAKIGFPAFGKALNDTGKPILYSCEWPLYEWMNNLTSDYQAVAEVCNIFRNYNDISDSFDSVKSTIDYYGKNLGGFLQVSAPGSFNDPDMLVIGDFGLSPSQRRVQMGMWAMFAAPLYMSNDLRFIDPESVKILQNKMAIAINQDPLGKSGLLAFKNGDIQIWTRQLSHGRFAVAALNFATGPSPSRFSVSLADLKVPASAGVIYNAIDIFDQYSLGLFKLQDNVILHVQPTGIQLLLFTPLLE